MANVADSLAAVKKLVFDEGTVDKARLVAALQGNYEHDEELRHDPPQQGAQVRQ